MRQLLWCVLITVLASTLTGAVAFADREPVVKTLEAVEATPFDFGLGVSQSCQVGNLNAAGFAISNFVLPPEDYKFAFTPMSTCGVCPMGFRTLSVHIFLQTSTTCTIVLSADVEQAVFPTPNCPAPGPAMCASSLYQVALPSAGLWNVALPISCDCLTMNGTYFLSVHFESSTCTPDLVTDVGPGLLCYNWNNYGTGWYDLLGAYPTWPGQLKIFADAECCSGPVPVEGRSWGAIKELYND